MGVAGVVEGGVCVRSRIWRWYIITVIGTKKKALTTEGHTKWGQWQWPRKAHTFSPYKCQVHVTTICHVQTMFCLE